MKLALLILFLLFLVSCGIGGRANINPGNQQIDPQRACASLPVGSLCGGGKYIGEVGGTKYVTTHSGCEDSATPVCDGTDDYVIQAQENFAADYCSNMVYNGHSDWVLPAGTVLIEMYNQQALLGGFVPINYWSNDRDNLDTYYAVDFNDGNYAIWWETEGFNVRCVRVSTN